MDIGCNIGHVTLTVARDFNPRTVTGVDIDRKLINIANKNIRHYITKNKEATRDINDITYPKSFEKTYLRIPAAGQLDELAEAIKIPESEKEEYKEQKRKIRKSFPYNVKFFTVRHFVVAQFVS